jgi:hypothetical protein
MAILTWDQVGQRTYETGVSKGVLFVQNSDGTYAPGVAWNGLQSVKQSNDGADETPLYADNQKYLSLFSAENLKGSIDAFTYPEEFEPCDGSNIYAPGIYVGQQARTAFALVYSTIVGNDVQGNVYGEKLHIIYNARVSPAERAYASINDKPEALTFSWNFTTTPVDLSSIGLSAAAGFTINKNEVSVNGWKAVTDKVWGTASNSSALLDMVGMINLAKTV